MFSKKCKKLLFKKWGLFPLCVNELLEWLQGAKFGEKLGFRLADHCATYTYVNKVLPELFTDSFNGLFCHLA